MRVCPASVSIFRAMMAAWMTRAQTKGRLLRSGHGPKWIRVVVCVPNYADVICAPVVQAGEGGGRRLMVGLTGYPNVGKSSTINALFGAKKTAVAPTPGTPACLSPCDRPSLPRGAC